MTDLSPKMSDEERDELAAAFLRCLTDAQFAEIERAYPTLLDAPEPWFRRHLSAEAKRRRSNGT